MLTVGIDEVGRGCWAGPVVAGAVLLQKPIKGLKDSKLLTKKQRETYAQIIHKDALAVGLGWVDAATIDHIGINEAVKLAMSDALKQISVAYDEVIIDGHLNFLADTPKTRALIKADNLVPAVSAASIVAKVARDDYMATIVDPRGDYGFAQHVGYGTALHLEMLKLYGVGELHRKSFKPVKALIQLAS